MTRLLVDDGGVRRSFKVGVGVLSIGSGPEAALRLTAPEVAEQHAELDVREDRVFLRVRPEARPPRVGGDEVLGEVELEPGAEIAFGRSRIRVEFKPAPGRILKPGPVVKKRTAAARAKGGPSRGAKSFRGAAHRVAGRRRTRNATWIALGIFAIVLVFGSLAIKFLVPTMFAEADTSFAPLARYNRARAEFEAGQPEKALAELDAVPVDAALSDRMAGQLADLRKVVEIELADRALAAHNRSGDEYLEKQLRDYEKRYLQGRPGKPAVRLFLERLHTFTETWPKHPQIDWVQRMRDRYGALVSLDDPPTYADVAFEVEVLTSADPRDYKRAFEVLDEFTDHAGAADRGQAVALADRTRTERRQWFDEKLDQSAREYYAGERGRAVAWLVRMVLYTGDDEMENKAAELLTEFQDLPERLRGYRRAEPEQFELLSRHPVIRDYLEAHPLD